MTHPESGRAGPPRNNSLIIDNEDPVKHKRPHMERPVWTGGWGEAKDEGLGRRFSSRRRLGGSGGCVKRRGSCKIGKCSLT